MRSFKDRAGAFWMLDITVLTVERVKAACGIDLPGLFGERMAGLTQFLGDDVKMVEVIFECCRAQEDRAKPRSLEDLKAVWDGVTADAATEVFLEDLVGFFRDPNRRAALRQAIQGMRDLGQQLMQRASQAISPEAIEGAASEIFDALKASATLSTTSSGNTPDTSASTRDPSPSAS